MGRPIRFLLDGEVRELSGIDPTLTVLNLLRYHLRRTGTKEGCAEGDCGACTVVLGELEDGPGGQHVRFRAVNACILFAPVLDGRALFTVESLGREGALHPVQQAMVDSHGSQCGFCTPGFVMSLYAAQRAGDPTDEASLKDALAGNLCRCTGYGLILAAGRRWGRAPMRRTTARWRRRWRRSSPTLASFSNMISGCSWRPGRGTSWRRPWRPIRRRRCWPGGPTWGCG